MQESIPDIFKSDQAFVATATSFLVGTGLLFLILGVSCEFFSWAYCESEIVPLFGGLGAFRPQFSTIALPMALLILGISIRMYSYFGWMTSLMLLGCLNTLFISLAYVLFDHLTHAQQTLAISSQEAIDMIRIGQFKISILVNIAFAIICTCGMIFLLLPSIRKMYWKQWMG